MACILQFIAVKDGNKESLVVETDVGIALLNFFRSRAFPLQVCEMLKLLSISTTDSHIGIAFLNSAQDILVETEYHDGFERREYLVLHVGHACLLTGKAKSVEGKQVALVEVLERDDGCLCVSHEFDALEAIVHQVRFLQSLP